jgi:hypothetical protein
VTRFARVPEESLVPLKILRCTGNDLPEVAMVGIYQDVMFAPASYEARYQQHARPLFLKPPVTKVPADPLLFSVPSGQIRSTSRLNGDCFWNCYFDGCMRSWRTSQIRVDQDFE